MTPTSHYSGSIQYQTGQRETIFKKIDKQADDKNDQQIPREQEYNKDQKEENPLQSQEKTL